MSFLEHLDELRGAILHSVIFLVVAAILAWPLSAWLQEFVIGHVSGARGDVVFMAGKPLGPLSARLKVTLTAACLLAAPAVFFRLWMFVAPGLLHRERKLILPVIAVSLILFYGGFLASFLTLGPQVPGILLEFSTASVQSYVAIDDVMSLILSLSLACGLVGEVPLVISFLVWILIALPIAALYVLSVFLAVFISRRRRPPRP
jgi:sec-independent protein translocase protein TatC